MLIKYVYDPGHIIEYHDLEVQENLAYEERPVQIFDRKVKQLRNKEVPLLKIQWNKRGQEETTWELEDAIKTKYPELFTGQYHLLLSFYQ